MDAIERFGQRLQQAFEKGRRSGKLEGLGNFAIVIHEKKIWSVLTKGPKAGIIDGMTDNEMDFIMITTLDVFEQMYPLDGQRANLDIDQVIAANKIAMHGDIEVFVRFLALNGAQDMLALRSSGAKSTPSKPKSKRARAV